jgi:hypothetical protein
MISLDVQNYSTVVSAQELAGSFAMFEAQANLDLNQYWDKKPQVQLVHNAVGVKAPFPLWTAYIYDDLSGVPDRLVRPEALSGAVGWHEVDGGVPYMVVLASTSNNSKRAYNSWTWAFSHELLEILVNPWDRYVGPYPGFGVVPAVAYGAEVCDPVEGTWYRYAGTGPVLSNFVTPAWFDPGSSMPPDPLDFLGTLSVPLVAGPGGTNNVVVL